MKRDYAIIRYILFFIEQYGYPPLKTAEVSNADIEGHLLLMEDERLLEMHSIKEYGGTRKRFKRMTSKGHDFLDAIRSESAWAAAYRKISANGNSPSLKAVEKIIAVVNKPKRA